MTYLMQLPGFGVITGMTVLAAIGEIQRFDSAQHLASYSGLTPGQEQSGTQYREKAITKEGRKELRWAMVEVAQRAVKSDPVWTRRQPYRHFSHERIAYKYLTWAWQMDEAARDGLTRQQFTCYYLMRLGIGHDLTRIAIDPKHPRKISSEAELLALRPELKQTE